MSNKEEREIPQGPHLLITGDPIDGFTYRGPFASHEAACAAGDELGEPDWWVAPLAPASTVDPASRQADEFARTLGTPISIGRQERQKTNPSLPVFYETRLHYGPAERAGNTVAIVYGNNSTDSAEQLAFAAKLVRAYNRDGAAQGLAEASEALLDDLAAGIGPNDLPVRKALAAFNAFPA